jgi:hypothetical protein
MLRFKHFLGEAGLNAGNLKRGGGNDQKYIDIWHLFLKNIQTKGHEFQTTDGKIVRLDVSSVKNIIGTSTDPETVFDEIMKAGSGSYLLPVAGGGTIKLGDLEKTAEYGGKASVKGATGALPEWYEESIAVEYNKLKGMKHETAVDIVFGGAEKSMSDYEEKTKIKDFVETGAKVASKLDSHINASELFHSGKGISGTINHYGERDITPKSDIYGKTPESRISVKMASSNSGAQIMSGKGGDSGGVIKGALAHYFEDDDSTVWLQKNEELAKLAEDTSGLIKKNYTNVYGVGTTKKGFQQWWMKGESDDAVRFAKKKLKRGMVFYNVKGKQVDVDDKILEKHVHSLVRKTRVMTGIASDTANLLFLDADGKEVWDVFDGYESDEVAQVEIEHGATPASIYADAMVIRYTSSMAKDAKDGIGDILRNATYGKIFEDRFKGTLEKNTELHKWIVYEAASGHYKFSGQVADPKNPKGNHPAIADSFLVFDKTGFKEFENVWVWSQGHTDILSDCNLVFKSSGQTKYLALRVKAVADDVEDLVDHVIQEEFNREFSEEYLVEFKRLKQMFRKGFDLVKAIGAKVNKFINAVVERVKNLVVTIAKGGFNALLEFFGLEVSGTATLKTPSW